MSVRNRLFAPLVLFLCLAPVVPGRAEAASRRAITSYDVPGCLSGGEDLAPAARKGVLFRACAKRGQRVSGTLAHLMPSGKLLRRRVPKSEPGPILAGPAGEIWSVAKFEKSPVARGEELSIDRIAASGSVRTFPLGSIGGAFGALRVNGLVADGAGAVWLAIGDLKLNYYLQPGDSGGGELLHIAVDGTVSRFPLPDEVEPDGLVRGPDGNLWFTGVSGRATGERTSTLVPATSVG